MSAVEAGKILDKFHCTGVPQASLKMLENGLHDVRFLFYCKIIILYIYYILSTESKHFIVLRDKPG